MLGLPKVTELHRQLPKKTIYARFGMDTAAKEKIDADISRITIVNEISPERVHIAEGQQIKTFFVVHVALKKKGFDEQTISTISRLIPQNMLFVLEHGDEAKLAIYHMKLMQTGWQPKGCLTLRLEGKTLDTVWENIIIEIGGVKIEQGNTLDEQIAVDSWRQKLEKEIVRLEKLARKEKQPKKKFMLVQQIKDIKKELEDI